MSFLNPYLLLGLPLISLPIIIHLINRQRHRTIPWGAMMFLLDAKKLQRSMAKLRYWIIMAMRMLAIAGLFLAVSRPLSSGWLGSAVGSKADTVLLLLDRSPSMDQQDALTGISKRETALSKLSDLLEKTGEGKRVVLIENTNFAPEEIAADQLTELPNVAATAAESDIPRMLQSALEYLVENEVGQADIWIASDLRRNDWREEDGRWSSLRDGFSELDGIRFHLLSYSQAAEDNLSVTVGNVRRRTFAGSNELVLDVRVQREGKNQTPKMIPIEFVVNGARSVLEVELEKDEFNLQGHVIPIDPTVEAGWGRVEVPGDDNPADNTYHFVFAKESVRNVTIVSDDDTASKPLRIASSVSPEPGLEFLATTLPSSRVAEIDWDETTLLVWQTALPEGTVAEQVTAHLAKNRPALFLPPDAPSANSIFGMRWGDWQTAKVNDPIGIGAWENDSDLLARTQSGNALPVGKQRTTRYCKLEGIGKTLARLTNGDPLLQRADGNIPAYFFTSLPRGDSSSLAQDGIVLYVMIQRAIEAGAKQQGNARQLDAGLVDATAAAEWDLLSELPEDVVSSTRAYHAASYKSAAEQWSAINRSASEDLSPVLNDAQLKKMFSGLDYQTINDELGERSALANEIWRVFLALMAIALIVEAALCLA